VCEMLVSSIHGFFLLPPVSISYQYFNLKTAVEVPKNHLCFDPSTGSGSARTVFEALTQLASRPFALSSLRSGRVPGKSAKGKAKSGGVRGE